MIVRDEEPADLPAIRALVEAAFSRAQEAVLVDRLRADGDSATSLVAVDRGEIVGHVLFSRMDAPFRAVGLAPVSAAPHRQRSGIGGRDPRRPSRAAEDGWQGVFVLGDPGHYQRFGFSPARASGSTSPHAGPHLMVLALDGDLPATEGKVDHAPAFAALV